MRIETEFDIGEIVFLITDPEQWERMITRIYVTPHGWTYSLSCGVQESTHYEMEMSRQINIEKQLNLNRNEDDKE